MSKLPSDDPEELASLHPLDDECAESFVRFFKLFADETRVRILHYLQQRHELNVQNICELLGQTQPAVSHHLAILRENNLVDMRRSGKHNYYRVVPERFAQLRYYIELLESQKA
jgi:ArsR family transcriptional regulator, arsenate/arsenite/antimonite-responsive transcriptional repressor